jgi:hypothetical protein
MAVCLLHDKSVTTRGPEFSGTVCAEDYSNKAVGKTLR